MKSTHPVQSRQAAHVMERRLTDARPGFISLVTMAQTVWALDHIYGLSSDDMVTAVERILGADALVVQNEQEVFAAIVSLKTGAGSFHMRSSVRSASGQIAQQR